MKFNITIYHTKGIMDYGYSDYWVPYSIMSKGGARLLLTFINDHFMKV